MASRVERDAERRERRRWEQARERALREREEMTVEERTDLVRAFYALEARRLSVLDEINEERQKIEEAVRASFAPGDLRAFSVIPPVWAQRRLLAADTARWPDLFSIADEQEKILDRLGGTTAALNLALQEMDPGERERVIR